MRALEGEIRHISRHLSKILSESGYVVISGLAEGIDTQAHQATLDHKGKTAGIIATDLREKSVFIIIA